MSQQNGPGEASPVPPPPAPPCLAAHQAAAATAPAQARAPVPPSPAVGFRLAAIEAVADLPAALTLGVAFKPFASGAKPKKLASAFGLPLTAYETVCCYGEEVPALLVYLWSGILRADGLQTEGIFRLAGDPKTCTAAERTLTKGNLPQNTAPEALAHLIKGFLRSLPGGLLGSIPSNLITECEGAAGCEAMLGALGRRERAVLSWLVRVTLEVSASETHNKMDVRNVTLVLAPNLFGPPNPTANPMEELLLIKAATNALHTLVMQAQKGSGALGGGEQGHRACRPAGRIALLGAQQTAPPPPPPLSPRGADEMASSHLGDANQQREFV